MVPEMSGGEGGGPGGVGEPIRVLLVDDEPAHREAVSRALEGSGMGYRVRTAGSLGEYRARVAEETPDVAILDLQLPDGRADTVLVDPPESGGFAQIVMTSHGDEQVAVAALKAGALDYVVKSPETFGEMPRVLDRVLRAWRLLMGRREAVETLKAREQQMQAQARLLDLAQDAIAVRDMAGRVRYWNEGSYRLTGWTSGEAIGRGLEELFVVEGVDWVGMERELMVRGVWSGELSFNRKDGRGLVVMSRWTLVRDGNGQPESVLLISTDVTERKKLEAQFLRAQRLESVGSLASGIAHDLNNILSPILMSAPLLREASRDAETRAMVDTIEGCARRGADITRQLLTFARGKPGARVPVPVRHLLREMEQILRETFPRDIRSSVGVPADLWPVEGDATQVHQALLNLCLNARDAMPEGGTLELRARNVEADAVMIGSAPSARPGPYVGMSVKDTGSGIVPEIIDRVFEPFFTTKELGKGTGLGLASVLGIVHGHGGFVKVSSRVGVGTVFELFFPASKVGCAGERATAEVPAPGGEGATVLVVEDEPAIQRTLQRALERRGYRVLSANHGAEGLRVYREHREAIRVVITDMMMPVMNGPTLVRLLRELDARLPIVAMTGLPERSTLKGFEHLDLPVVLTKPFSSEELVRALQRCLAPPANRTAG